ncbi:hypothetical protein [Acanthopleuribacter pedis]|uniref:Uncharacterized protein n=1 Tax=Acanthopleuribacter pedis TaxID=442870 RepID=A0A8J7QS11_9BACT|nr:hypothetical protein [Acanthopleuribacter pedis]MBO1323200.1 hypothetical protein [Acanthopleuribacter pedis]
MKEKKQNNNSKTFRKGPPIDKDVISWLDKNAHNKTIRLPVEIHISLLSIKNAFLIGPNFKTQITLDTGKMSIDLPFHLKSITKDNPCRVWLEGTWGHTLIHEDNNDTPTFSVQKVIKPTEENEYAVLISK